ncbi:MAG: hypothetical protein JXA81_15830 [Sedimentisphaerales bacterium]|nr:hypothetical protein [Sedimentisphaerales bacterium]
MKTKMRVFYIFAIIVGGCVPVLSLHPLYMEKDVVLDQKLYGTWVTDSNDSKTIWEFKSIDDPKNAYTLIFTDEDGRKGSFVAHLVKLQDKLFLDIFPSELPWELEDPNKMDWPYNSIFLIPAHTFIKVDSIGSQLKLRLTLESKMKELIKENPNAIEYTSVGDRLVFTGSTKKLQSFVLKYANDERVFTDQITLSRK